MENENTHIEVWDIGFKKPIQPKIIIKNIDIIKDNRNGEEKWQDRLKNTIIKGNKHIERLIDDNNDVRIDSAIN